MLIYKCTNRINGKLYIGKTISTLATRRKGHEVDSFNNTSGSIFLRALNKYGLENFDWVVICEVGGADELNDLERFYILKLDTRIPNGYNITEGGDGGDTLFNHPRKQQIIEKRRESIQNFVNSLSEEERKQKYTAHSSPLRNKTWEEFFGEEKATEMKKNLSEKCTGYRHTPEAIEKISQTGQGRIVSEETKEKIRRTETGKVVLEETKQKQKEAGIRRFEDPEERRKQSVRLKKYHQEHPDTMKGEKNPMYGKEPPNKLPRETRICAAPGCDTAFEVIITSKRKYCCNWHGRIGKCTEITS